MREVAQELGVATSSVSRVLSGHPDVSPKMRNRVLEGVRALGYQPNMLARSLRSGATFTVGFLVSDNANPLFAEIVKGAESKLREEGYSMLLTNSDGDPELDVRHIALFAQRWVDGLILSTATEAHPATIAALEKIQDRPVVAIDRELPPTTGASRVLSDHFTGMAAAVTHLLELGHRRIALLIGEPMRPTNERRRALEETFAAHRLPPTYVEVQGHYSAAFAAEATRDLLSRPNRPTAIIAAGNQMLLGALESIAVSGVELGRDVSLVGCDDVSLTALYRPPIAVVVRDNRAVGTTAASLLLGLMRGDDRLRDVLLPTRFVARPSCGPPRPDA